MRAPWLVFALLGACDGGGGASGGGNSDAASGNETCLLETTLSGGIDLKLGPASQACGYSARSVAFAPLGAKMSVLLFVKDIEAGQTGSFSAQMEVNRGDERWSGAVCAINVDSNVKSRVGSDASISFDQYLLKGSGTCSTPATFVGDGGTEAPITIAPFTFAFQTLFY